MRGSFIVEGYCGMETIEYVVTNATLRSITADVHVVTVTIELEKAVSGGTVVLKIPKNALHAEHEVAVFADGEDLSFREINVTAYYRTITIDFEPGTEEIEIVGEGVPYNPSCPAGKQEITTLYVNVANNTYPLGYYMSSGGSIDGAFTDQDTGTMTIVVTNPTNMTNNDKHYLDLTFQRELYDVLSFTEHEPFAFVDGQDAEVEFVERSCDQILLRIHPIEPNTEEIEIVRDEILGDHTHNVPRIDLAKTISVEGKDGEQDFGIRMVTDAIKCDASFVKEEKKIHIDIRSGSDKDGFFRLTVPHDLLGGNYTVLVDGKQVDFREDTFFTNSNTDIDAEFVEDPRGIKASHLIFNYPVDTSTIDVIGRTAAPEFGSVVAPFLTAIAIIGVIVAAKQFRYKQR